MKVCIIGSSFASAVISEKLSKLNINIDIVDIDKINEQYQKKYLEIFKPKILNVKKKEYQYHGWGGGSNVWHGVITKFDKPELNKYKKLGINFNKIYKKFSKSSLSFIGVKSNFLQKNTINKSKISLKCSESDFFEDKFFLVQKKPFSTKNFFKKISKKRNVNLIENSCAVSFNFGNLKINYLNIIDLKTKKVKKLYADIYILCCGAIESPRVLLQSIVGNKYQYKNKYIGKGINDHYKGIIGKFNLNDEENIFDIKLNDSEFSRVGFVPQDKVFGNYCIIFRQAFNNSYIKLTNNIKKYLKEIKFLNLALMLKNLKFKNLIFLLKKFFLNKRPLIGINAEIWIETETKNTNLIKLTKKKDKYGRYIPKIKFSLGKKEKSQILHAQKNLDRIFSLNNKKYFKSKHNLNNFSSGSHFSNTCRIGKDISNSVVDKNLKVHNLNNLYICDNSILNFTGNSNPTFSLISLSFRLADYLKGKLR